MGRRRKASLDTNITLIGMPGVGKSTIGVIAAKILGLRFLDTDLLIQEREDRLLSEIIEEDGIEGFLKIEEEVLSSLDVRRCIIATGGSAIYGERAMAHLKSLGPVVYLKLGYGSLRKRLGNLKNRGVVLREGQTLRSLYEERIPLYERYATLTVDETGLAIEETVAQLVEAVTAAQKKAADPASE